MPGYRDTSNYDPYANPRYGKPLRPFNWVQWTGVALAAVGFAMYLAYFAGVFGWIPQKLDTPTLAVAPLLAGVGLINSRREEVPGRSPEIEAERRRLVLIVTLVCVVVFGLAIAIDFVRS